MKIIFGGFKDITSLGIASFITNAIGGVFWLYMASMIGTEKYGEISYFISIAILASTIALEHIWHGSNVTNISQPTRR